MKITPELKQWLIENCDLEKEATDEECSAATGKALATEALSVEKYTKLVTPKEAAEANEFSARQDKIAENLSKITEILANQVKPKEEEVPKKEETSSLKETETVVDTKVSKIGLSKTVSNISGNSKEGDVHVKTPDELYSTTRTAMINPSRTKSGRPHSLAGERTAYFGRGLDVPSQLDEKLAGIFAAWQVRSVTKSLANNPQDAFDKLTEHEKSLLHYLAEKGEWDNSKNGFVSSRIGYPGGIKAVIDDAASGGLEAAPIVFDDQVISTPLLHGELFPLVNTIPIDRGRRIEGVATGTVTGTWGGVDDTPIALFNTAGYITAFDTTIFRWEGAIQIGLDFLSDTPIDFGQHITTQYGERLLEDLDDVIAAGDGTTQPEGIITAAGTTSVIWSSATSLANYESLRFSVPKPEHKGTFKNSAVFCGTETTYQRAKAIPVGTVDARRIFAGGSTNTGTFDDYGIMERPFKINESLTNLQVFYAIMARYRMYRRRGLTVRTSTEGQTLILANEMLITVTARYGGQIERGAIAGVVTDAPA